MLALRLGARISPLLGARLLEKAFLSTRRHEAPERERVWLDSAKELALESRGRRLAGWSWGHSGRSILLVHGWEGRGSQLGAFVEPLLARGFRVVTFDGPGHGRSPGSQSSLVEMGAAVQDAFTKLGPFHGVVAHSAGAAATTIALCGRPAGERLVYLAPPADLGEYLGLLARALKLPAEVAPLTIRRIERRFGFRWEELAHSHLATRMTAPLLVIHDSEDREIAVDDGIRLTAAWRESRLEITEGLGHRRILRDEKVVARAVSFLSESARSAPGREEAVAPKAQDRGNPAVLPERRARGASGAKSEASIQEETRVATSSDRTSPSSAEASTTRSFPSLLAR